ncbi:MAG: hypothetical protein ACRCYU_23450 [Nocardioides sp.]
MNQNRVIAGTPDGGQFAATARDETDVALVSQPADDPRWAGDDSERAGAIVDFIAHEFGPRATPYDPDQPYYTERLAAHLGGDGLTAQDIDDMYTSYLMPIHRAIRRGEFDRPRELAEAMVREDNAERQWKSHPTWREPDFETTDEDNYYGAVVTGDRRDIRLSRTERNKRIRADIKDAIEAGYLPSEYGYSVTSKSGSHATSITVTGMKDEDQYSDTGRDPAEAPGRGIESSWKANQIHDRLKGLGLRYGKQQSNSQVDYFNDDYYCFPEIEEESSAHFWRAEKIKAAARKATKDGTATPEQDAQWSRELSIVEHDRRAASKLLNERREGRSVR